MNQQGDNMERTRITTEIAKREIEDVWNKVFGETPRVEFADGGVTINEVLEIRNEFIRVERKTLRGLITTEVDGYGVYAWVRKQNLPDTPDDVDDYEVGTARNFDDALMLTIIEVAKDKALRVFETNQSFNP